MKFCIFVSNGTSTFFIVSWLFHCFIVFPFYGSSIIFMRHSSCRIVLEERKKEICKIYVKVIFLANQVILWLWNQSNTWWNLHSTHGGWFYLNQGIYMWKTQADCLFSLRLLSKHFCLQPIWYSINRQSCNVTFLKFEQPPPYVTFSVHRSVGLPIPQSVHSSIYLFCTIFQELYIMWS